MKPGLYPQDAPRHTESHAECRVHDALRQGGLPAGWYAWHSLRVRDAQGLHGEGDFVIAKPGHGFLVLEVKGGALRCEDGRWLQNGRALSKSPLDQAHTTASKLRERLHARRLHPMPSSGVALCFPDTSFSNPPSRDDLRDAVLGGHDLPYLADALAALFARVVPPASEAMAWQPPAASGPWLKALHEMWCETWTPALRLGDRVRAEEAERVRLDRDQLLFLDAIEANARMLVRGCAGSGKTLLALEAARRRARLGERVLYLCFTKGLAGWVDQALEGSGVTVRTVRQLAVQRLRDAGASVDMQADGFWEDVGLAASLEAHDDERARFDTILLDEGQDLSDSDWAFVEGLARGARCWCFADQAQGFWSDRAPPARLFAAEFTLSRNHRCPPALALVAQSYAGRPLDEAALREARDGHQLGVVPCADEAGVRRALERELEALLAQGLAERDIAILSLRGQSPAGSISHQTQLGRRKLVRADDPDMDAHVVADTFLRFKGLERPAILVTDLPLVQDKRDVRLHIALTRALSLAKVVAPREALAAEPTLARLLADA